MEFFPFCFDFDVISQTDCHFEMSEKLDKYSVSKLNQSVVAYNSKP